MKRTLDLGSYDGIQEENPAPYKRLTWNRDPVASLSDWSIVVTSKSDKEEIDTYHVHKCLIGAGPRGSQYFLKLFTISGLKESQTCTSKLDLEETAASAFPDMLDFMYASQNEEVKVKTETAVAMRHLANYFGIPTLFESTIKFIQEDMNEFNIHIYLKEARQYHDESIIEATMEIFNRAWRDILVSEDGSKTKESLYMELLTPSEQVEVLKRALLNAVDSKEVVQMTVISGSKRVQNQQKTPCTYSVNQNISLRCKKKDRGIRLNQSDADYMVSGEEERSNIEIQMDEKCLPIYYFDEQSKQWIQSDHRDPDYVQRGETETTATKIPMNENYLPIYYFDEESKRWIQSDP
mmetsp:Transcript_10720/g.15776  ORF Transcript_10720/g.15776 Transcript_10720/m.15776 type:complete len:351 (+) Transcript_10720:114-1166(+)|eukprot:CAMPEP_0194222176 /NCGR_PEP_ID=MMETSP0156-20130528/32320_1 /TAXON_ID=33649 /ORGANISM="Thalassionema nitzschioides, Strain L26-B" /LENGTH=350 /DNA_ID=CAMNT_0038952857 /DNA_START=97 /DNA_END=1149 /DNA_ORIENTATION=-